MRGSWLILFTLLVACTATDLDGDGASPGAGDCNDADAFVHVGAVEYCDGRDNDCNLRVDEYFDLDQDGFVDRANADCANTFGAQTDCDDDDPAIHPGGTETCDGTDEDCTGHPDDAWDLDMDGASPCGDDCDDHEAAMYPGAVEVCDGLDNDCDLEVDEDWDQDGDGFAPCRGDCDDDDPAANPFTVEICDGVDQNCDGLPDEGFDLDGDGASTCAPPLDCDDSNGARLPGALEICDGWDNDCDEQLSLGEEDLDWDGSLPCAGDCDDMDSARAAGFPEICDLQDNDCDPTTDESLDGDLDGVTICEGDCDDLDPGVSPDQTDGCDGVDNDCDGVSDEGDPSCLGCTGAPHLGHQYWFCPSWRTFEDAAALCISYEMDMVAVDDEGENDWLWAAASAIAFDWWWIGLQDDAEEGTWLLMDGSPAEYLNWAPNQPDNWAEEDCVHFFGKSRWNDIACGAEIPFICESGDGG